MLYVVNLIYPSLRFKNYQDFGTYASSSFPIAFYVAEGSWSINI